MWTPFSLGSCSPTARLLTASTWKVEVGDGRASRKTATPPAASPRIATVPAPTTKLRSRRVRADFSWRAWARASSRAARALGLRLGTRMSRGEELVVQRPPVIGLAQLPGDLEDDDALWVDEYRPRRRIDLVRVSQVCGLA